VPTKTVRCWVPCPTWEEHQVTCYQRCCECVPVKVKVCCYRHETRQVACQVTCCKCVPEERTETYQVMVMHKVPYQATRCVAVCTPCQPAPACCENTCCQTSCCDTCSHGCRSHKQWFHRCSGLNLRHEGCGCCD
jgi:hypothetical protein